MSSPTSTSASTADPVLALADIPVHDPFILAADGTYHLYTASPTGVVAYTSTDLAQWRGPATVFTTPEGSWADAAAAPWAPEVHSWRGRYYLFVTLHDPAALLPATRQGSTRFDISHVDGAPAYLPSARGTVTAVADSPLGPFTLLDPARPVAPPEFMTLDGTLFVDDDGQPWMVYAHEWLQLLDGTIEAVRLSDDLARAVGDPVHLFRGSEGSWLASRTPNTVALPPYVTDGPQLRRLGDGSLLMLWSSYALVGEHGDYVETSAVSPSGSLLGPWRQNGILVGENAGHGMLFDTFDGRTMLVLHRGMNTPTVRAELHEVREAAGEVVLASSPSPVE
jgi:hypothetical protein